MARLLVAHPLLRVEPTSSLDRWQISLTGALSGHRTNRLVAALAVRAIAPASRVELVGLAQSFGWGLGAANQALDLLVTHRYVVEGADAEADRIREMIQTWRREGWAAAIDYHLLTYGYPFEHYEDGHISNADYERMIRYSAQAADVERATSRHDESTDFIDLPPATAALADEMAEAAWAGPTGADSPLDATAVTNVLSLLVSPTGRSAVPWPGAEGLLLKTTPSGGARHPTEVYVASLGVEGLRDGCYHASALDGTLEKLAGCAGPTTIFQDVVGFDSPARPWVLIIYTSVVRRNWYRYREPRTFRTIHMDVGHLMTTCEALGRSYGLRVRHHRHIRMDAAVEHLRTGRFEDVPLAATVLSPDQR